MQALSDSEIVDTNGAGDAFAGGLLAALVLEKSLDDAIDVGHKMGSMSVQLVCDFVLEFSSKQKLMCCQVWITIQMAESSTPVNLLLVIFCQQCIQ